MGQEYTDITMLMPFVIIAIAVTIRILKYRYLRWKRSQKYSRAVTRRSITLAPWERDSVKVINYIPLKEWNA